MQPHWSQENEHFLLCIDYPFNQFWWYCDDVGMNACLELINGPRIVGLYFAFGIIWEKEVKGVKSEDMGGRLISSLSDIRCPRIFCPRNSLECCSAHRFKISNHHGIDHEFVYIYNEPTFICIFFIECLVSFETKIRTNCFNMHVELTQLCVQPTQMASMCLRAHCLSTHKDYFSKVPSHLSTDISVS